jgi:iron complex transport system ATP-binding protein
MVTIELAGVGARYGQRSILEGISTPVLSGGEVVAVVGPNAAGKSTLFKRIAGLIDGPGQVRLEGSRRGLGGICYMPQNLNASARLTVYESVLLARKQQAPGWAVQADELEVVDRILESMGIGELSIAQTLVREPEVLLMDEPTSALDMHRQVQVLSFMRDFARQHSVIVFIAIHDLNQALRFADQVLVIANGTSQGCGRSDEVITEQMLRDVYRVQARIERCSREERHIIVDDVV